MIAAFTPSWIAVTIAGVSAFFGLLTYRRNANTKRAEFLLQLHQAFFVDDTYKPIRVLLDDREEAAQDALKLHISQETPAWTDFLNFFELVAYFQRCKTLHPEDVSVLLGYYLNVLRDNPVTRQYIKRKDASFESLDWLLQKRS